MAGSKGSKYYDIFLNYSISLSKNDVELINDKLFELLKEINIQGSITASAEKLGISYRKAWGDIKKLEEIFGFQFVEKQRGGNKGGKSVLIKEGQSIVDAYDELKIEFDKSIRTITRKFFRKINE